MNTKAERVVVPSDKPHFQGELYIGPVITLPTNIKTTEAKRENGSLIVGHSESGHHHTLEAPDVKLLETGDPLVAYLVAEGAYADLVHHRPDDTHATLVLESGGTKQVRKVIRQRENSPTGWQRAAD